MPTLRHVAKTKTAIVIIIVINIISIIISIITDQLSLSSGPCTYPWFPTRGRPSRVDAFCSPGRHSSDRVDFVRSQTVLRVNLLAHPGYSPRRASWSCVVPCAGQTSTTAAAAPTTTTTTTPTTPHEDRSWPHSMPAPPPFRRTPRGDRGSIGSSTESGTHNAVLTVAYGWAFRPDFFFFFWGGGGGRAADAGWGGLNGKKGLLNGPRGKMNKRG